MPGVVEHVPAAPREKECAGKPQHHLLSARIGSLGDGCLFGGGRLDFLTLASERFDRITFSHFHSPNSGSDEAAAESADELDVEGESTGFELGDRQAGVDDAFLRGEHVQVGRQPVFVAPLGKPQRRFV